MKKKRLKKSFKVFLVVIFILFFIFLFYTKILKKEQEPVFNKILYSANSERRDFYFYDDFLEYEELEKYFKFYGRADLKNNLFSFVKDNQSYLFEFRNNSINLKGVNICDYKIIDDKFYIEVKKFLEFFNYNIKKENKIRLKRDINDAMADIKDFNLNYKLDDYEEKLVQNQNDSAFKYSYILAWDLYGRRISENLDKSIDIIMPTWLKLQNENGDLENIYRPQYVQDLKKQDIDLWVVVNNKFDINITSKFLNNYYSREKFINSIINYLLKNNINGLNVDFENMYLADSDVFVQFLAELNQKMKLNNRILSVCTTVPKGSDNWSKVYDRRRIAEVSNFITLMAYDQYFAASQIIGPVAGFSWVDKHLKEMSEYVPSKKIILGVPFYTRLWYETLSTDSVNKYKVKSRSLYMSAIDKIILDNKPIKVYDEENRQYFYAYYDDKQKCYVKFWYDDENAISEKVQLVLKYNLSGVGAWAIGYEKPNVWDKIRVIKR